MSPQSPEFEKLIADVSACRSCERMDESVRVLSWANGDPASRLMFIGEAPGRLGADRTSIPFHGDKAGDNFERLIALAGITRSQVFVTNAILCNPRDKLGNNSTPSSREIDNCGRHLRAQIEIIRPVMVMTLGNAALDATRLIEPHALTLRESVRTISPWFGRLLLPLYHPGARAMIHRSFANQTADYYFVGESFRRLERKKRPRISEIRGGANEWSLVKYVLQRAGRISNFRLHKLMYLIDVRAFETLGERATRFLYLRQKDGPYCVELGSRWYQQFGADLAITKASDRLTYEWRHGNLFLPDEESAIEPRLIEIADNILSSTAGLTESQLKTRAYLTRPMKQILRAEKSGQPMLNRPVLPQAA